MKKRPFCDVDTDTETNIVHVVLPEDMLLEVSYNLEVKEIAAILCTNQAYSKSIGDGMFWGRYFERIHDLRKLESILDAAGRNGSLWIVKILLQTSYHRRELIGSTLNLDGVRPPKLLTYRVDIQKYIVQSDDYLQASHMILCAADHLHCFPSETQMCILSAPVRPRPHTMQRLLTRLLGGLSCGHNCMFCSYLLEIFMTNPEL